MIEMFELHASMPPMRSVEYQATIPLKCLIIIHNYQGMQIFRQSTNQITTQFSGTVYQWRHRTALTAGWFRCCWEEKTTRSNRMKFRLSCGTGLFNYMYAGKRCNHNWQLANLLCQVIKHTTKSYISSCSAEWQEEIWSFCYQIKLRKSLCGPAVVSQVYLLKFSLEFW